ncbi:MAG: hypothetical protein NTX81_01655 [Candidatus Bathyarchaeota archaeon]|nr:hypothetical protein [Candidatus Bathyarchaeota archaeon]
MQYFNHSYFRGVTSGPVKREEAIQGLTDGTMWFIELGNGKKATVEHLAECGPKPFHVFDSKKWEVGDFFSATEAVELAELSVQVDES